MVNGDFLSKINVLLLARWWLFATVAQNRCESPLKLSPVIVSNAKLPSGLNEPLGLLFVYIFGLLSFAFFGSPAFAIRWPIHD